MKAYYYDHYDFPLPDHHRFPKAKYSLLRQGLQTEPRFRLTEPPEATDQELLLAHDPAYIGMVRRGSLPRKLERELGLPLDQHLAKRVLRTVGATIAAGHTAMREGIAGSTGGGTHHAQYDRPQGYCVFNDAIVALRVLQREGLIRKGLVIDCDVHQGNGTALLAENDPSIYTFSIHCEKNFPARKATSDLDIGLPIGTGDDEYLAALEPAVDQVIEAAEPDLVIYLAGADPHENDRLGKLSLTKTGLAKRDELVFDKCIRQAGLPLVLTMAGGYGKEIEVTAGLYRQSFEIGLQFWGQLNRSNRNGNR